MAINKKLIHFKLKSSFETELANNNILDTSIVFIQETKEIWTHGQLYKCSDPDLSNYVKESELQELLSPIQSSLANKLEVSDLAGYAKTSDIPAVVTDSTVSNWGFMKTSDANETYAPKSLVETVSNQSTTISTLATKNELSTGLAGKLDNSAASSFVPTTRTINGTALTDNIWITATDPNAATKEELNGLATTVANKAEVSALANFATTDALSSGLSGKQETLVSGTNIKTIEGKSILGSGDIQITAAEVGAYTTGQVDEKVTALNNAISGKVDPSTVNAVSDRVSTLEGYFSTAEDSDATINKWGEIVNFLDGVAEGSNVEQLLAAKANQSALDNLSTTVSNVDAKFANYLPTSGGTLHGNLIVNGALAAASNISFYERLTMKCGAAIDFYDADNVVRGILAPFAGNNYDLSWYDMNAWRTIWHSGNFNPADYLPLNGGILGDSWSGGTEIRRKDSNNGYASLTFSQEDGTILGRFGFGGVDNPLFITQAGGYNTLLHSGNIGDYALKTDGSNVMTGSLNFRTDTALYRFTNDSSGRASWYNGSVWKTLAFTDSDITGNAATATKLATPRTIWGQSFDGTGNVDGAIQLTTSDQINGVSGLTFNFYSGASVDTTIYNGLYERIAVFRSNGNVLIGTAKDASKLTVSAKFRDALPSLGSLSADSDMAIHYDSDSAGYGMYFSINGYTGASTIQVGRNDGDTSAYTLLLNPLGGNVGIGTTSTSYKLHVEGDGYFSGQLNVSNINGYTPITSGNIGEQSVNYANSAGSATDQTARDAAATAQSTANGKWTWNASDVASVKVNNAGYADSAGSAVDQTARNSAAAKWAWNADEIKAVKVNNASNADKLDNIDSTGFLQNYSQNYGSTISSATDISPTLTAGVAQVHISNVEYSSVLTGYDSNNKAWQLRFRPTYNDGIYFRSQSTGTTWQKLAFSSDIPTSLPANGGTADYASSATYDSNWNHIANTYATKGEIPSVGNGTITITQNGTSKGSFTLNQSGNATIELTDTNTHPDLSGYATQSWVSSNFNYSTDSWRPVYNGVDSTATDTSASANAVRLAYGRADEAYNLAAGKQDVISDLSTIRSQASNGNTAYSWGNHANAGYFNASNVWNNPETVTLGTAFGPTEMYNSIQGFINNGTVVVKNGTLYVMDNPSTPVSTHWLDVYSDPQSYGGVFYEGQIILDLYPDRFYDLTHNPLISTLTINSISGWNNIGLISHNIVRFKPGSSAFTLTLPSGIYWANGNPIECDDPDSIYEISFIKRSGGDEITATWTKFTQA